MDYFIYNGVDSRALGIYIGRTGGSPLISNMSPPSRVDTIKIAGKHGEVYAEQFYERREIDVDVLFTNLNPSLMKQISRWLCKLGTFDLMLSTEPYKVYKASFEEALNPSIYNSKQAITSLTFTCYDPFGYSAFTAQDIQSGVIYNSIFKYNTGIPYADSSLLKYSFISTDLPNIDIFHGGNTDLAMPKITITGSGDSITIGRYSDDTRTQLVEEHTYGAFSGELVIDSEISETYLNGIVNNLTSDGDYFTLTGVKDMQDIQGGSIISMTSSSAVLNASASDVDDYYNGNVLALLDGNGNTIYKTVIDYVGSTRTITFSTIVGSYGNISEYFIYKYVDLMNYFKITGTSLSITSIDFDFKFVYL